uniref:Rhomboid domain-containing protein n=1 Tax=Macrostomum lignano TaxID=282301 RepID=A0A1I8F1T0_9PLAT
ENIALTESGPMENYSKVAAVTDAGDSATVSAPEPGYDIPPHRTTRRAAPPPPPPLTSDQNEFDNARQPTSPSRIRSEEDYRLWLESNFQHYFDQHEAKRKLSRLMTDMNANPDGRVSWKEFFSKLTITRRKDLSRTQLFLVELIRAAVPAVERYEQKQIFRWTGVDQLDGAEKETDYESYLEAYNCRPPSIFIPVCCLAQIICFYSLSAVELNKWTRRGSVCSAVFDHTTALVGASGGCYALMGAHIALHEWLKCRKPSIEGGGIGSVAQFLLSGVMRLVFLLLLLLALDFGVALYQRYGLNEDTRVSFLAHAGRSNIRLP